MEWTTFLRRRSSLIARGRRPRPPRAKVCPREQRYAAVAGDPRARDLGLDPAAYGGLWRKCETSCVVLTFCHAVISTKLAVVA